MEDCEKRYVKLEEKRNEVNEIVSEGEWQKEREREVELSELFALTMCVR